MTLGERIRLLREEKGLTQQGLAEVSGVCQQMISKLEVGNAHQTSDIVKLAYALEVSPLYMEGLSRTRSDTSKSKKKAAKKKQARQGESANHKALQASIEYLTESGLIFEYSGYRRQADLLARCYEVCTRPKNKALSKKRLITLLKRHVKE